MSHYRAKSLWLNTVGALTCASATALSMYLIDSLYSKTSLEARASENHQAGLSVSRVAVDGMTGLVTLLGTGLFVSGCMRHYKVKWGLEYPVQPKEKTPSPVQTPVLSSPEVASSAQTPQQEDTLYPAI